LKENCVEDTHEGGHEESAEKDGVGGDVNKGSSDTAKKNLGKSIQKISQLEYRDTSVSAGHGRGMGQTCIALGGGTKKGRKRAKRR